MTTGKVYANTQLLKDATLLTIASGVVTVTQQFHIIAAESGTTDDLDTITPGWSNLSVGGVDYLPMLFLKADTGDTITLKHATGNLTLPGDTDLDVDDDSFVILLWDGTNWIANKGQ